MATQTELKSQEPTESARDVLDGFQLLTIPEVMLITRHKDRCSFWQWAKSSGLPMIRMSPKRFAVDPDELREWLDARRIGGAR